MPKAEVGSAKWLGNKMKSKGLQKLRWYCQMCQKQCRDENGFKCHTMSESHQRQLLLFADSPHRFLGEFSHEFEAGFLNLLKRRFNTKRVHANQVYQEYIRDKDHVHMNGTRWSSLTGFVLYLGKTGKAVIDETEKGWYIAWIDRDPETIARQEALNKKDKMTKDDAERMQQFIQQQVERNKKDGEEEEPKELKEFHRDNEDEKIALKITASATASSSSSSSNNSINPEVSSKNVFKMAAGSSLKKATSTSSSSSTPDSKRKKSALDEIKEEIEEKKRKTEAAAALKKKKSTVKPYWLTPDIVVKIVTKSLGDKYYKQKGFVREVVDKYTAVVIMLNSNSKVKLDQEHLETVVPAVGRKVLIVNGKYRGETAELIKIDVDNFQGHLKLEEDDLIVQVPYEHFSKLHT